VHILVSSIDADWDPWIAAVLRPMAEAFGFRAVRPELGEPETTAFEEKLAAAVRESHAAISIQPAAGGAGHWTMVALSRMDAQYRGRTLLLRRPGQPRQYPTGWDIALSAAGDLDGVTRLAQVLGDWNQSPYWTFQLGPALSVTTLLHHHGDGSLAAQYRVRTHIGDLTEWRQAELTRVFDRIEVRTRKPAGGGSVQVQVLVNGVVFGETDFTRLERRVLDLAPASPETFEDSPYGSGVSR
jgi:hypothetical protein